MLDGERGEVGVGHEVPGGRQRTQQLTDEDQVSIARVNDHTSIEVIKMLRPDMRTRGRGGQACLDPPEGLRLSSAHAYMEQTTKQTSVIPGGSA
jgi:hypothetical protein